MPAQVADTLVAILAFRGSLRAWREAGTLEREWALLDSLRRSYANFILITFGGTDEHDLLASLLARPASTNATPEAPAGPITLICNDTAAPLPEFCERLPALVAEKVRPASTALVMTLQMEGGECAAHVVQHLRTSGVRVGLVGRGASLWSRTVAHEHGPASAEARIAAHDERVLCQASDIVVGTTPRMVEDLAWRYALDPARAMTIPNYAVVDHDPLPPEQREPGLVVTAGKLVARKRVHLLIEAIAETRQQRPEAHLEIIGQGPQRESLQELARSLGAPVTFREWLGPEEYLDRLARCAIFATASEMEGQPKAVLEAMASGAAVVVADATSLAAVVQHGVAGLRVQPEAGSYAHVFTELLSDEEWRGVMGSAAARLARSTYALSVVVPQHLEAHRRAMRYAMQRPLRKAG